MVTHLIIFIKCIKEKKETKLESQKISKGIEENKVTVIIKRDS